MEKHSAVRDSWGSKWGFILDCIGYTVEMKERVQALTGKSVLLPRTLAARVVKELA